MYNIYTTLQYDRLSQFLYVSVLYSLWGILWVLFEWETAGPGRTSAKTARSAKFFVSTLTGKKTGKPDKMGVPVRKF